MPDEASSSTTTPAAGPDTTRGSSISTQLNLPVVPQVTESSEPSLYPPSKPSETISEPSTIQPPLSQYEEVKGKKYTTEYFDIVDPFVGPENPLDRFHLRENVKSIESYVNQEIARIGLEDSTSAYESVIQKALETIGKVPYEKKELTLVRLGHYIRYVEKLREADKTKKLWLTSQSD